jgi:hypothetical protein
MTGFAGLKVHVPSVFFMALHTNWDLAVNGVTLVAGQISMSAWVSLHLLTLLWVA